MGIELSADMKSSNQCPKAFNKANKMLGMIHKTIKYKNPEIMVRLYKTLVRPHLEYCTAAWSPHYSKDKELLEKVQHKFTRMMPSMKNVQYEDHLKLLKLWTPEERRNCADIIEVYKILNGHSSVSPGIFFDRDI